MEKKNLENFLWVEISFVLFPVTEESSWIIQLTTTHFFCGEK